jgi:hypothetical protein
MTQRDTTIVKFPAMNTNKSLPLTKDDADLSLLTIKMYYIQKSLDDIMNIVINHLEIAGFAADQTNLFSVKECALIAESIRSYMFTAYNLNHPMQRIADEVFTEITDSEDETDDIHLDIRDSITIDVADLKKSVLRD